jgi:hypothetical protein
MIRGLDPDLWHEVRVEAVKRKLTVGALLNEVLREWLRETQKRPTPSARP